MKPTALEELEALSRIRPLTDEETRRLQVELSRAGVRKGQKPWTDADLLRLRAHLLNGIKPREIAAQMDRTERAIWRTMNIMGWTVRDAQLWVINPKGALNLARARKRQRIRVQTNSKADWGMEE